MCGFGIHMEPRPHRFDRKREENPKEWEMLMYKLIKDPETGEEYGWGRVLDYIGVEWEEPPQNQLTLFDVYSDDELYGQQIIRLSEYARRLEAMT